MGSGAEAEGTSKSLGVLRKSEKAQRKKSEVNADQERQDEQAALWAL